MVCKCPDKHFRVARNLTKVAGNVLLVLSNFYGKTKFEVEELDMCGEV